jgi:hypothetical protein
MKVFQDLELRGNRESLTNLMEDIRSRLSDGWERAEEVEHHYSGDIGRETFCFSCTKIGDRESATLFLVQSEPDLFHVSNIIPRDKGELSIVQYNRILNDFYERFVRSAAEEIGVNGILSSDEMKLEDLISHEAAKKLRTFSSCANRSTGSSHPIDRERWYDFLVTVHREDNKLGYDILFRWLVEEEKWPEEIAHDLIIEYEFAGGLISFCDRR